LVSNALLGNALLVQIKASQLSDGLGLGWLRLVNDILPPWQTILVIVDLEVDDDTTDLSGDESSIVYDTNPVTDTVDLAQGETDPVLLGIGYYCM